jgi:zinc protease
MNSLLFTEIRDKRNLCYTIYSTFDRNVERGAFRIYTATSPDKRDEAIKEILVVLKGLYDNGVTDEQVATAKTYINGMYKIGMQDYMGQADSYSSYEITGLGYAKVDTFLDSIMKVSKADVDAMIKKYFVLDDYTLVIVGGEPKNDKNQETK